MTIPPGYADVSIQIKHTAVVRPAYVTFGIDPSGADPTGIATQVHSAAVAGGSLLSLIDSTATLGPVTVRLGQDGGEPLVGVNTVVANGTQSGTMLPPNCAALVHKRTGRGGRRGRGRMFIPWCLLASDVAEGGIVGPVAVSKVQTACEVFRNALSAGGNPMVVLHDPGITSAGPPDVVTSMTCDGLVSTQRRRLGR